MSFSALKQNRANDIQSLVSAAESIGGGGEKKSYADERFWKPTVDKAGNGYAVLRFLPAPAARNCRGFVIGIMASKAQPVFGTSKTV